MVNPDLMGQVLASPAYQTRCEVLFDLFRMSRQAGRNATEILEMQVALAEILRHFQSEKAKYKKDGNDLGLEVMERLILILKRIADAVVWRVLGYDRVLVQLLAEHPQTGHVDETVSADLQIAQDLVNQGDRIVLVNDLTTILRHGDLTIIGPEGYSIEETKQGKASSRNRRAIRQKRAMDELCRFYNTGVRVNDTKRDFIIRVDVPVKTHHSVLAEVVTVARKTGYHHIVASDCLAIEALCWIGDDSPGFPQERPFETVEHRVDFDSLQTFDKPASRVAPFGIFPLDDQSCFDLITGNVMVVARLNFDALQKQYEQSGLILSVPRPSEQEREAYLLAPMGERKKLAGSIEFVVGDGNHFVAPSPDLFGRIGFEFIHEETIVKADRQVINLIRDLKIPNDKATRFYVGYKDEGVVWA